MIKGLFSRLKDKYGGLKPREKQLFWIALAVVSVLLADRLLFSPIRNSGAELTAGTEGKLQLLTDIRKYVLHREWQKELYKGKASDFLNIFMKAAKDCGVGPVRLKKTENSAKGILVRFECNGSIQKILDFILKMEKMDFAALFQRADIILNKGSEYHFEGEILVLKG